MLGAGPGHRDGGRIDRTIRGLSRNLRSLRVSSSRVAEDVEDRCPGSGTLRLVAESCTELEVLAAHCSHVHEYRVDRYLELYMVILSTVMVYILRYNSYDSGCSLRALRYCYGFTWDSDRYAVGG